MTTLKKGTPLYDEVFAGVTLPDTFESDGPDYDLIKNGFLDPSNRKLFLDPVVTNAVQAKDVRRGLRMAVADLAVDYGTAETPPNFPSALLPALRTVLASSDIPSTLTDSGVGKVFATAMQGDVVGVAGAVLGIGMTAIGVAVPVVGWIGAAIVALAGGLYALITAQKDSLDKEREADRARLYRSFPPLQEEDAGLDGDVVNKLLLPRMRDLDWTPIFMPRFDGADWVGIEREGGYAFAPGKRGQNTEEFGGKDAFVPSSSKGLGVIPGTDQVTAVVQVSLVHDPDVDSDGAWQAFIEGGKDPRSVDKNGVRGWTRVHDTGMYYPATGRLAASLWSLALSKGNPWKYRLDAVRMHAAWKTWAEGGLRYIREVCYPWYGKNRGQWPQKGRPDLRIDPNGNYEGFFGTGIFEAIGAWACLVNGGSSANPDYAVYPAPFGITGPELAARFDAYGFEGSSVSSLYSGPFLPILDPSRWPDKCMGTVYDRGTNIAGTLDQLQAAQRWELRNTLVCAQVSERDAAFAGAKVDGKKVGGDPKLLELLRKQRAALLESDDRFYVDLDDVLPDEPGVPGKLYWESWRKQLEKAGVTASPKGQPKQGYKMAAGEPPPGPAPFVPGPGNPWQPQAKLATLVLPEAGGGGGGLAVTLGALGLAGLGVGLARAFRRRSVPRRGHVGAGGRR